jgi:multicomponent Na+:H+ antiporter subunit E
MRTKILYIFLLILFWIGLNFNLTISGLIICAIICVAVLVISCKLELIPSQNNIKFGFLFYVLWLFKEIYLSALYVTKLAWKRNKSLLPGLAIVESDIKSELGMVIYANSITLTPGTVTLSVDKNLLLVHAIDSSLLDSLEGGEMESRIIKVIK